MFIGFSFGLLFCSGNKKYKKRNELSERKGHIQAYII